MIKFSKKFFQSGEQLVAIKEINLHKKIDQKSIYREAQVLRRLKHSNILRCFQFHKLKNSIQIVLEYCPGGSLGRSLK